MGILKRQPMAGGQNKLSNRAMDRTKQFMGGRNPLLTGGVLAGSVALDIAFSPEGEHPAKSVARGAAWSAAFELSPKLAIGAMVGPMAVQATTAAVDNYHRQESRYNQFFRPNIGGTYQDTQSAMTMRQAGAQAIQQSKMNARSALGTEASLMHNRMTR